MKEERERTHLVADIEQQKTQTTVPQFFLSIDLIFRSFQLWKLNGFNFESLDRERRIPTKCSESFLD